MTEPDETASKNPLREIAQPFIDVARAPRALWGVNFGYLLEGMIYFGVLGYLAMYFNQYVGLSDSAAGVMVGVLTWGITLAMFFLGGVADRRGVRYALLASFGFLVVGRILLAAGPSAGLPAGGMFSAVHLVAMAGILLIVLGYGLYQPAAYTAVRQFTTPATAAMGYAMLYALMNLGGWLPSFFAPIRRAIGIAGAIWVYVALTIVALLATWLILSRRTVEEAIARARAESGKPEVPPKTEDVAKPKEPFSLLRWLRNHPMADPKFSFFIFALIPVQTLFAHNWLTLPMYVERAYRGTWTGDNFEVAVNFNPLLIFILVPIVTALSQRAKVYNMMIAGTAVMAAPTFLLAIGPSFWTLFGFLVLMTIGEAMWQPRFLQYAAEIAPEGRTGAYMGVAQFPWFLTKMIVSLYSGWFLEHYCPAEGALRTEKMWFIYGLIAMTSTVLLILARNWLGKDFKTRAD